MSDFRQYRNQGRRNMLGLRMKKGFTLAELLIVVAIIGVLVAVAIPIFSRSLERAREATCMANRRSLYAQVIAEHILSDRPCSELFNEYVVNAGKCPSGGTFSWEDSGNAGIIKCDYHDGNGGSNGGSSNIPPLQPSANPQEFTRGTVIQDETGTCVIMSGTYYAQLAYEEGKTVSYLVSYFPDDAKSVKPSEIKDSSSAKVETGDLYYDSKENKYYYVTTVGVYEKWPQTSWVPLLP